MGKLLFNKSGEEIPPFMITIEGAKVSPEAVDKLQKYFAKRLKGFVPRVVVKSDKPV